MSQKTKKCIPVEANLSFPHPSTLVKQFDFHDRKIESEFSAAWGSNQRHKDEEFHAPQIELVGEEKELVHVLLTRRGSPQSGQETGNKWICSSPTENQVCP